MFLDRLAPFFYGLFRKPASPAPGNGADFEILERNAPVRETASVAAGTPEPEGLICREVVVGADQRVAGYQFMLREGTRSRIRSRSRHIHHVYAEVLVRNVAQMDVARLLGDRKALLDLPDSFLGHASIATLPPQDTVLVATMVGDDGTPAEADLLADVRHLRQCGYAIAVACPELLGALSFLQTEVDYAMLAAADSDPVRQKDDIERLRRAGSKAAFIARGLPSQDDFQLCRNLGVELFQGPFVTRREDWHGNKLGPNTAKIADLLARLRRDADTAELVALVKQDGALSLRLMRYMNSAAIGLHGDLSSIERAVMQLGRDRLYRWLMLLLYGADKASPRSAVILENALVRARLMELLGEGRPATEHDALFLVGLLSLVDVALEVPMSEAIASIATAPDVEAAVLRGEGPLGDLLTLVIACETGDAPMLEELARRCDVTPALANRRHLEAFAWALEVTAAPAAGNGEGRC